MFSSCSIRRFNQDFYNFTHNCMITSQQQVEVSSNNSGLLLLNIIAKNLFLLVYINQLKQKNLKIHYIQTILILKVSNTITLKQMKGSQINLRNMQSKKISITNSLTDAAFTHCNTYIF